MFVSNIISFTPNSDKICAPIPKILNSLCFSSSVCCELDVSGSNDCYRCHTRIASDLTAKHLGLREDQWEIAYQSRIGPGWLTPFTDKRLAELPKEGKDNIAVLCPSFISDCLETLEEIAMEGKEEFLEAGGTHYNYVPCLNDDDNWAELISNWTKDFIRN